MRKKLLTGKTRTSVRTDAVPIDEVCHFPLISCFENMKTTTQVTILKLPSSEKCHRNISF